MGLDLERVLRALAVVLLGLPLVAAVTVAGVLLTAVALALLGL